MRDKLISLRQENAEVAAAGLERMPRSERHLQVRYGGGGVNGWPGWRGGGGGRTAVRRLVGEGGGDGGGVVIGLVGLSCVVEWMMWYDSVA